MRASTRKKWTAFTVAISMLLGSMALWPASSTAHELRAAFAPECPTTEFPTAEGASESPAIAIAIATSLATSLVDTGIAALKKAVNPGNATLESQFLEQGLYVYKGDPNYDEGAKAAQGAAPAASGAASMKPVVRQSPKMGCLVVAAGTFTVAEGGVQGWRLPFKTERQEPTTEEPTSPNWRVASALGLKGPATLALYMEATRVFSADRTAVTWKPVRVYVGDYLNDSFWAGKSRSISIELRLYRPGKKEAFFSQDFSFDNVIKPLDKSSGDLSNGNIGEWNVLPAAPSLPADLKALPEGRAFDPYTLEVRIVESPKPYALAQAFADAVEKNKDAIKKEVTEAIDSKAKASAELTASGATLDAVSSYLDAYKAAAADCAKEKMLDKDGKPDKAGSFNCSIARDKALVAKQKAELACKANAVDSCSSLPEVPSSPS